MNLKLLAVGLLLLLTLVFAFQNAGAAEVKLLGWKFSLSLALVIFGAFVAGLLSGWVIAGVLRLKAKITAN